MVENILIGAQTKGQFHLLYGAEGTQALFTGLATQVIYGGCDADTAEFYSKASGTATTDANQDDPNSHLRQRPLLTVDEVVTPQVGNCTIFARYVEAGFATQVVLNARLTRFYEREDWKARLAHSKDAAPLLLERGLALKLQPPEEVTNLPDEPSPLLERAAEAVMDKMAVLATDKAGGKVKTDSLNAMKARLQQKRQQPAARLELST
ncbi:MAG: TraM recognition domain-containing protein [Anaerolineae bacterium]|nr:TraM recognition domain-containing protein [Anaerolineae bacterium]